MKGSPWTMPFIVLNMGGEMVYILHQRLQAQTVQDDKARKVLQDVVRAMFSPMFINELFKPQNMYSTVSTKQIFEKLAHSSIMRLNKSSMEKLYDLMTMGFKYQMLSCATGEQFMMVTLNHLETIKALVKNNDKSAQRDGDAYSLVNIALRKLVEVYGNLSKLEWYSIRLSILRFVQGKKVKVSLFLQKGMQALDGVLVLSNGGVMGYGTEIPVVISTYDGTRCISTQKHTHKFTQPDSDTAQNDEMDLKPRLSKQILDTSSSLGKNLFSRDSNLVLETAFIEECLSAMNVTLLGGDIDRGMAKNSSVSDAKITGKTNRLTQESAKAELTMLSDLLCIPNDSKSGGDFKLNLFPEYSDDFSEKGSSSNIIVIDGATSSRSMRDYMTDLSLNDDAKPSKSGAASKNNDEDDDLLALMDSASK